MFARFVRGDGLGWAQQNGVFVALLLLLAVFASQSDRFLTWTNVSTILLQVAVVGIIAVPGAMLILSGYIDLSVGSVAVLASIVFGEAAHHGLPIGVAVLLALGVGAAWGCLNGFLIARLEFSPIVVTLAGLASARGLAEVISQGQTQFGFGAAFGKLGNGTFLGLGTQVWVFAVVFVVGAYLWHQAPHGRHMTAIGADRNAARAVGIRVTAIPFTLYVASGLAAAVGGLIVSSQLDGASLSIGENLELSVLTAILLGGVSFVGGRGSMFGVLSGLLFIGALSNGLVVLNVGSFWQGVATGIALTVAAGLDVVHQRLERIPIADDDLDPDPDPAAPSSALASIAR